MGTASVVQDRGGSSLLHTRGTWSPREDRTMYAVCLALIWVGMIGGFALDFPNYLHQNPPAPMILHVHAVAYSVWMLIVTAQVTLVMKNRVRWHMTMGWFALGWACVMAVVGPWAVMSWMALNLPRLLHPPFPPPFLPSQFLAVNLADLVSFLALLSWGFMLRKNPAAHKRLMILSTVALADPGFARLMIHTLQPQVSTPFGFFWMVFYGNVLLVVLMTVWDLRRGRLMTQFVIGATGMLAVFCGAAMLFYWPPWQQATLGWVQAWARHFG